MIGGGEGLAEHDPSDRVVLSTPPALPRADAAWSRRHVRVDRTGVGIAALATLMIGLGLATAPAAAALGVALLLTVAVDATFAFRGLRGPVLELSAAEAVVAEEPSRWELRYPGLRRPVVAVPALDPVDDVLLDVPEVGTMPVGPLPRGTVSTVVVDLWSTGPVGFAIAARRCAVALDDPVAVGPAPAGQPGAWMVPRGVSFGVEAVARLGDDLFRGVRPYQRGDERRHIHWKATARQRELMVRDEDGAGIAALQVVVELDGPMTRKTTRWRGWRPASSARRCARTGSCSWSPSTTRRRLRRRSNSDRHSSNRRWWSGPQRTIRGRG